MVCLNDANRRLAEIAFDGEVQRLLRDLPPPWKASRQQIAEVSIRVGFQIVYRIGDQPGWHPMLDAVREAA